MSFRKGKSNIWSSKNKFTTRRQRERRIKEYNKGGTKIWVK
jgi:hypothetical protein